jgi:hypothetical protein
MHLRVELLLDDLGCSGLPSMCDAVLRSYANGRAASLAQQGLAEALWRLSVP